MTGDPLFSGLAPDLQHGQADQVGDPFEQTLAAFSTPAGAAWLARMEAQLVQAASYAPGMDMHQVAWLEGKRHLVLSIKGEIQMAQQNRAMHAALRAGSKENR